MRPSFRISLCSVALALAFFAWNAATPVHAASMAGNGIALQTAPSTSASADEQTTARPAPSPEQNGTSESSGDNDVNVYRHSPMVQSIARLLHLPVETTARIFEGINFLILAGTILWFTARLLPKMLRERKERIQRDLQNARKATEDAQQKLQDVERRLARLDAEIAGLKAQVEQQTAEDEARVRASMEAEKQRLVQAVEQETLSASANAQRRLRTLTADLIVQYATQHISPSTDEDRALVQDFIEGLENKANKNGGNN